MVMSYKYLSPTGKVGIKQIDVTDIDELLELIRIWNIRRPNWDYWVVE